MAVVRATVKLNRTSGVAKDASVNVWHLFRIGPVTVDVADGYAEAFETFYSNIGQYFGATVSRVADAHTIEFAEVATGLAGAGDDVVTPVLQSRTWTLTGAPIAGTPLPSEVAVCMSYRGDVMGAAENGTGGTRPRARRRGRIYLGPLGEVCVSASGAGHAQVAVAYRELILASYEILIGTLINAEGDVDEHTYHIIYSPTGDTTYAVRQVHVDNAFDILRTRGEDADTRSVLDVDQGNYPDGPQE